MASSYKGPLDYIDVATRIVEFREKYPTGSLQQVRYEFVNVGGKDFIIYTAAAYRTPDDIRPGVGTAWEPIPGPTNFTRDSEVQNAETAAWGRAIVAVLAADTRKGIASSEEVRNRQEKSPDVKAPLQAVKTSTPKKELSEAEKAYLVTVLNKVAEASTLEDLRTIYAQEKDLRDLPINGTTVLDAINARVAVLS
jgi:hypothetical protein